MAVPPVNEIGSDYVGFRLAAILNDNSVLLQKSIQRLTSGLKLQSAGDDPAGAGISVKLQNQIARVGAASKAVGDVTSYVQSQTDFLDSVSTSLSRMSELATLSTSGTATAANRSAYQVEFSALQLFVSDIGQRSFNNLSLFNAGALTTIIDENGRTFGLSAIAYNSASTAGGLASVYNPSTIDVSTTTSSATALSAVSVAIGNLSIMQAAISARSEILGYYKDNLTSVSDNLTSINNRIVKTDATLESAEFNRLDLLTQTGTTMIANWNSLRTNLLSLFK